MGKSLVCLDHSLVFALISLDKQNRIEDVPIVSWGEGDLGASPHRLGDFLAWP